MNTTAVTKEVKVSDISTQVLAKVEAFKASGELRVPKDYSPENALKASYLILSETKNAGGQKALEHCTKESIANALLKMVVWGLSPLKKQCDFIMYGDKLDCSIEYTGNIALAKRFGGLKDIKANAIFEGDEFEFEVNVETGRKKILKHKQTLESIGSKNLKGAYAVKEMADGTFDVEIMNMQQIRDSWNQGAMKGNSPAHKNFPDQMAVKTVINRACKLLIRGSDDSALITDDDDKAIDVQHEDIQHEISQKANKEDLNFEEAEVIDTSVGNTTDNNVEPVNAGGPNF